MWAPSMPLRFAAENEVVARRAPRGLLEDLDVGQAVFGEDAFLLGDDQRRRVGQRDVAELGAFHLGPGALREGSARKGALGRCREPERAGARHQAAAGDGGVTVRHAIPGWLGCTPN